MTRSMHDSSNPDFIAFEPIHNTIGSVNDFSGRIDCQFQVLHVQRREIPANDL